jgi:hypothetical protein
VGTASIASQGELDAKATQQMSSSMRSWMSKASQSQGASHPSHASASQAISSQRTSGHQPGSPAWHEPEPDFTQPEWPEEEEERQAAAAAAASQWQALQDDSSHAPLPGTQHSTQDTAAPLPAMAGKPSSRQAGKVSSIAELRSSRWGAAAPAGVHHSAGRRGWLPRCIY